MRNGGKKESKEGKLAINMSVLLSYNEYHHTRCSYVARTGANPGLSP